MVTYHQQHEDEEGKSKEEIKEASSAIQSPVSAPSPSSTSPSHEFSFTISLHSSSDLVSDYKTKTPSPIAAADLSPADDIFFHGHLLPLHLLPDSHLPVSPRLSTSSLDIFSVTGRESFSDPRPVKVKPISKSDGNIRKHERVSLSHSTIEAKVKNKSKSFSLFRLKRLQKGGGGVREETEEKENQKKKIGFDVSNVLKRYMRMIRPLLFFRRKRKNNLHLHSQAYSFSGNLSSRNRKPESRGRGGGGGYYSAPSSMRTSPSHSGLLVATKGSPSTSDSTMEELQAAIQSAIAHCKNSIKGEEKLKY